MTLTTTSNLTFGIALVLYLAAMVGYFHYLAFRKDRVFRSARATALTGLGTHAISVTLRGVAAGRVPWGNLYEYATLVGLLIVAVYLLRVEPQTKVRTVGGFVLAAAVLAMATAIVVYVPPGPLVPALNSYWIRIHVVAAMAGSSLFILGTVFSVLFLVSDARERRGAGQQVVERAPVLTAVGAGPSGTGGLPHDYAAGADEPASNGADGRTRTQWLPASGVLDRLAYRTIAFAFPIWTFAVIAGAIWAELAWGRYWGWDPKEVWSFITWVVFAGYLHARATVGWRGRRAAVLAIVGFAALAFNLYAVNLVISGLHSYA
ncbi:MAG: c-type cytochrome biogenesis protein CcsB [Actinomycetota bacterium]